MLYLKIPENLFFRKKEKPQNEANQDNKLSCNKFTASSSFVRFYGPFEFRQEKSNIAAKTA